jgi:glucosyl-dolichyl phosphate glucuronosyltransferase
MAGSRAIPSDPREIVFSIVLCTRNRSALLSKACESLLELDYPAERVELVLVDNASTDDTPSVARAVTARAPFDVRHVVEQRIGLSAARNRGIGEARGRYVFFTDDDQLVDPALLSEHERVLEAYSARVAQGRIELVFDGGRPDWLRAGLASLLGETPDLPEGPTAFGLYGGNLAIRRDVFDDVGMFREDLGKGAAGYSEDSELALRLRERGEPVVYAPGARVFHVIERERATAGYALASSFEKGTSEVLAEKPLVGRALFATITLKRTFEHALEAARRASRAEWHESLIAQSRAAFNVGKLVGYARLALGFEPRADPGVSLERAMHIDEQIAALHRSQPALHVDGDGKLVHYGIDGRLVSLLRAHVRPGQRTLETGHGLSSILFLLLGAEHRSIVPDPGASERIYEYCRRQGIETASYAPLVGPTDEILPALPRERVLDVVLIGGDHAFPAPCIEWHFMTRILKRGGIVIVNDVEIWSRRVLADFLEEEEVWERLERTEQFAAFRMLVDAERVLARWWGEQPLVVRRSSKKPVRRSRLGLWADAIFTRPKA